MTTRAIIQTAARIASLETSLRIFRNDHPAAAARVSAQLDAAYLDLARLEAELLAKEASLR